MSKDYENDEPIIEVITTVAGEAPEKYEFPITTVSGEVSGVTVPKVAKQETGKSVGIVTAFLDHIKENFKAEEHDLVVKFTEKEEIDRGWFSHMDLLLGGTLKFDGGTWEGKVKGTPKKEKRTKETTVRISLEKKAK